MATTQKSQQDYILHHGSRPLEGVNRQLVLTHLQDLVEEAEFRIVTFLLSDTTLQTRIQGCLSTLFSTSMDTPQGNASSFNHLSWRSRTISRTEHPFQYADRRHRLYLHWRCLSPRRKSYLSTALHHKIWKQREPRSRRGRVRSPHTTEHARCSNQAVLCLQCLVTAFYLFACLHAYRGLRISFPWNMVA